MTFKLSRRSALAGLAATPLAFGATKVSAAGHVTPVQDPIARSFKLGDLLVTTLLDASVMNNDPKGLYGLTPTAAEFDRVSQENFIPSDRLQFSFTPTLVDTGSELVLFDTGLGRGGLIKALASVGVQPIDIDVVVITHMHTDHIGGLIGANGPTFPNARHVTAAAEYDFWSKPGLDHPVAGGVAALVTPIVDRFEFVEDGARIASGITAVASFGHTPGRMCYMLDSGGCQLLLTADLANHYVWSFARPDWEFIYDFSSEQASATRRRILGMLAADGIPMVGYHMPFPVGGFVETRGDGFHYVPVSYQFLS